MKRAYWADVALYAAIGGLTAYVGLEVFTPQGWASVVLAVMVAIKAKLSEGREQ